MLLSVSSEADEWNKFTSDIPFSNPAAANKLIIFDAKKDISIS